MLEASTLLHDRYRIIGLHEMGRENAVYRAYDESLKVDVAIKENAHRDDARQRQFRSEDAIPIGAYQQQFRLEGVILANLVHPNIPRAIDFLDEDGRQFIVMDFIEGINLQQLMKQRRLGTEEILDWVVSLCDTLAYLHSRVPAIIHRDVEPSNIILANNGQIFLVDFGYVKVYSKESEAVVQKRSVARTDARSDQYSLAATLYCLLAGAPPVDSLKRAMDKETLQPIQPPRPDLPASVEAAIYRALSIDPAGRFKNIEEFKAALQPKKPKARKGIWKLWH